ncbi:MAG TPA: hypothetical protein VGK40_11905 [Verrucomicrobiae bacterium]|jgi:hypothetical protein
MRLCAELNRLGARYVVVGGFAIIQHGFQRFTQDIDLLIETTPENEARVIQALLIFPDQAAAQIKPGDVGEYGVIRVGDEVLVDLMKSGCGVSYAEAAADVMVAEVDGVRIPFASAATMWRMKKTIREKDIPDRLFLRELLTSQGVQIEPSEPTEPSDPLTRWRQRFRAWWRASRKN